MGGMCSTGGKACCRPSKGGQCERVPSEGGTVLGVQVCQHDWVASRGGLVPRLLDPGVARGAANVASVRRLRNMVHGFVALKQLRRWGPVNPRLLALLSCQRQCPCLPVAARGEDGVRERQRLVLKHGQSRQCLHWHLNTPSAVPSATSHQDSSWFCCWRYWPGAGIVERCAC